MQSVGELVFTAGLAAVAFAAADPVLDAVAVRAGGFTVPFGETSQIPSIVITGVFSGTASSEGVLGAAGWPIGAEAGWAEELAGAEAGAVAF
ncbi:MAG TPA: hypothetical protein VM912_15705 [Terriglobales bacterium]|nr:hypothetical protein [Terriglobales bacterium]